MVTEDYVSFEIAKLLKEKGFDEESWCAYDLVTKKFAREIVDWDFRYNHGLPNYVASAPTLQMAIKWLREVHKLYVVVRPYVTEDGILSLFDVKSIKEKDIVVNIRTKTGFDSYEQACETAIKYCLENLI